MEQKGGLSSKSPFDANTRCDLGEPVMGGAIVSDATQGVELVKFHYEGQRNQEVMGRDC